MSCIILLYNTEASSKLYCSTDQILCPRRATQQTTAQFLIQNFIMHIDFTRIRFFFLNDPLITHLSKIWKRDPTCAPVSHLYRCVS